MSKFRVTDPGESFYPKPSDIVYDCAWNKSTAFTEEERRRYGIEGMLPIATETMEVQLQRVYRHVRSFENPLNKYLYLSSLKQRNEVAFFRLLVEHLEELMPIVYTPTVGEACMNFSMLYRATEGFYLSYPQHRGRIRELLNNWPRKRVDIVVVTDGSRILGLGDLGVNGMGIPIGKLSLYVACAGFHPQRVLPVVLDVGTNNERLLADPLYLGNRNSRIADGEFFPFVDEFMSAVRDKWPSCLVQFEDFSNNHCFRLLDLYRHKQLSFNDDIQGTGAVVASAFVNAVRASGLQYRDQRLVFLGAGSAGVGVSDVIARVMAAADGVSAAEARRRFWLVDSKGLITKDRGDALNDEKERYARDDNGGKQYAALADIVRYVRPTAIVGLAGQDGGVFTAEILRLMASFSARPVVMALSNPTSKAECTFQEAMDHTGGKAIFASGSPFPAAKVGQASVPNSQANNSYIFPGLGFGAVLAHAREVTDGMLAAATRALAEATTQEEFAEGRILPRLERMREISAIVASAVIQAAFDEGVAAGEMPQDVLEYVRARQFYPSYNEQSPAML